MIQLTVDKEEYQQILEALQVYSRVCADEQKKKFAQEIQADLTNLKKEHIIETSTEPNACD
jgi:DNA-directed RNA polymerase specialized sigma subunit